MLSALYRGFYNLNSSDRFQPTPNCATGNCTWEEPYTSIGICGRCTDVTQQLVRALAVIHFSRLLIATQIVTCSTFPNEVSEVQSDDSVVNFTRGDIPYCNYTLPARDDSQGEPTIPPGIHGLEQRPVLVQINSTFASSDSHFGKPLYAHINAFTVIRATPVEKLATFEDQTRIYIDYDTVNATECGFDVCVKKYTASMDRTVFTERVLDTFTNTTKLSEYDEDLEMRPLEIHAPSSFTERPDTNEANIFSVWDRSLLALRYMFDPSDTDILPFWSGAALLNNRKIITETDVANYLSFLLQDHSLDDVVESVAASHTQRMREAPGGQFQFLGSTANGTMYQDIPFVHVRWPWMAFPAALVILTLLFLLFTMARNAKDGTMLWKANSLANFYHPLTKDGRDELQSGQSAVEAEEIAERMKVKWARTEVGVRLVQRTEPQT